MFGRRKVVGGPVMWMLLWSVGLGAGADVGATVLLTGVPATSSSNLVFLFLASASTVHVDTLVAGGGRSNVWLCLPVLLLLCWLRCLLR